MKSYLLQISPEADAALIATCQAEGISRAAWLRRGVHSLLGVAPPPPPNKGGRPPCKTRQGVLEHREAALLSLDGRAFRVVDLQKAFDVPLYRARAFLRKWVAEGHVTRDGVWMDKYVAYSLAPDWALREATAPCGICSGRATAPCRHWYNI